MKNRRRPNIIFDLDGVLCTTCTKQALYATGLWSVLKALLKNHRLPSRERLFEVLAAAPARSEVASYHKELSLPAIMVDWQCGLQDLASLQKAMSKHIHSLRLSNLEKELLTTTALWITDPKKFVKTRCVVPQGAQLLHELKNKGYPLYVLSNWDPFSFELFKKKFPEIFIHNNSETFSGILTSGDLKLLKPDVAIFKACLEAFKLNPRETIFIDDTLANVQAAQSCGMGGIVCYDENIDEVRCELKKLVGDSLPSI